MNLQSKTNKPHYENSNIMKNVTLLLWVKTCDDHASNAEAATVEITAELIEQIKTCGALLKETKAKLNAAGLSGACPAIDLTDYGFTIYDTAPAYIADLVDWNNDAVILNDEQINDLREEGEETAVVLPLIEIQEDGETFYWSTYDKHGDWKYETETYTIERLEALINQPIVTA